MAVLLAGSFWAGSGSGWATAVVLFLVLLWQAVRALSARRRRRHVSVPALDALDRTSSSGISDLISDDDLRTLMNDLEGDSNPEEAWEEIICKRSDQITYTAKCCRSKEGPVKYLSTTVFENCSTERLRDFYMDNEYRKAWDRTVVDHQQLELDEASGTEVGRTIKKFPLLALREYVLAWRVWQAEDGTFYCFIKECEHPSAPRLRKYVRVGFFRSGWRIRKVAGRDASEIRMVHREDAGLNPELARLAFAKGIWSFIGKMNAALRAYPLREPSASVRPLQVPRDLQWEGSRPATPQSSSGGGGGGATVVAEKGAAEKGAMVEEEKRWRKPSKTWIAKGLLLAGGLVCLARGHSALSAQIAVACVLKKLAKHHAGGSTQDAGPARLSRGRRAHRHRP
ncbi:uncharacterized protein LOC144713050 [Wolffia australiana]